MLQYRKIWACCWVGSGMFTRNSADGSCRARLRCHVGPSKQGLPLRRACAATPTMKLEVTRWDEKAKGPPTKDKILGQLRKEGYNYTTYRFGPGTVFGDHTHGCDKKDSIISGKFFFRMGGEEVILEAGDMLVVPKGKTHYAEVVGSESCEFVDASKW